MARLKAPEGKKSVETARKKTTSETLVAPISENTMFKASRVIERHANAVRSEVFYGHPSEDKSEETDILEAISNADTSIGYIFRDLKDLAQHSWFDSVRSAAKRIVEKTSIDSVSQAFDAGLPIKELVETVKKLVNENPELANERDGNDKTVLMKAAGSGIAELVEFLISKGAEVNATLRGGHTALIFACTHGHVECAQILISHGADVNAHSGNHSVLALTDKYYGPDTPIRKLLDKHGAKL